MEPDNVVVPSIQEILRAAGETRSYQVVLEEVLEQHFPDILRRFYPRRYEGAGKYFSPKMVGTFLAAACVDMIEIPTDRWSAAYRLLYPALRYLIDKRMPLLFITPELLRAIQMTDFTDEIDWREMHLPYESGIFVLPRGSYKHPVHGECGFVVYTRNHSGIVPPPWPGLQLPEVQLPFDRFCFVALCWNEEMFIWFESNLNAAQGSTVKIRNMFHVDDRSQYPMIPAFSKVDLPLSEQDKEFLDGLGVIVFGTLLALTARPQLLTPARLIRQVRKKKRASIEWWVPLLIGKDYRLSDRKLPAGTHASPRLHWRRGHFRMQAHGPHFSLRKQIWIEPVLVGA